MEDSYPVMLQYSLKLFNKLFLTFWWQWHLVVRIGIALSCPVFCFDLVLIKCDQMDNLYMSNVLQLYRRLKNGIEQWDIRFRFRHTHEHTHTHILTNLMICCVVLFHSTHIYRKKICQINSIHMRIESCNGWFPFFVLLFFPSSQQQCPTMCQSCGWSQFSLSSSQVRTSLSSHKIHKSSFKSTCKQFYTIRPWV